MTVYSVTDMTTLKAAMERSDLNYGDAIELAAGDYGTATDQSTGATGRRTTPIGGSLFLDGYVEIRPAAGAEATALIHRLGVDGSVIQDLGFNFKGVTFRMEAAVSGSNPSQAVLELKNGQTNWLRVEGCNFLLPSPFASGFNPQSCIENSGGDSMFVSVVGNYVEACYDFVQGNGPDWLVERNLVKNSTNDVLKMGSNLQRLVVRGNTFTDKSVYYTDFTITGITLGNPTVVNFTTGPTPSTTLGISFSEVVGATWLNRKFVKADVTASTSSSVTLNFDSTGLAAWTSGGMGYQSSSHGDFVQIRSGNTVDAWADQVFSGNEFSRGKSFPFFVDGQGLYYESSPGVEPKRLLVEGHAGFACQTSAFQLGIVNTAVFRSLTVLRGHAFDGTHAKIVTGGITGAMWAYDLVANGITGSSVVETNTFMQPYNYADHTSYEANFVGPFPANLTEGSYDAYAMLQSKVGGTPKGMSPEVGLGLYDRSRLTYVGTRPAHTTGEAANVSIAAPVLSALSVTGDGTLGYGGTVVSSEWRGNLFWVLTQSVTAPTRDQIKAGQNHLGVAADGVGHAFITTPQAQDIAGTGLAGGTDYYFHCFHEDPWYQRSGVATSSRFTTVGSAPNKVVVPPVLLNGKLMVAS